MRRGLTGTVALGLVLGAVALAGATTRTDGGTVDDETRTFTAECPSGERVDVGGFKTTIDPESGILVEDLTFKGGGRKWAGTFDGLGDPAPATVYAYCADTPRLDKETDSSTAVAAPRQRGFDGVVVKAKAECPRGTTVQLGGFTVKEVPSLPGPRGGDVDSDFRPASMKTAGRGTKWKVKGTAAPGSELTAVAGCADLPAPKAVTKTEDVVPGQQTFAKAKCGKGDEVVMGGFKQTLFDGSGPYIRTMKQGGSRKLKVGTWEFDAPAKLTSIAYCG